MRGRTMVGLLALCAGCGSAKGEPDGNGSTAGTGANPSGGSGGVASGGAATGGAGAGGVGAGGSGASSGSGATGASGGSGAGGGGGTPADCASAALGRSNLGCVFWAVDLPNERVTLDMSTPASDAPWGVLVVNTSDREGTVVADGSAGQVASVVVPANGLGTVVLPQAEITGTAVSDPPGPPGTQRTFNAFRLTSDVPIAAFQITSLDADVASADVSLLLPQAALGTRHRAINYPPATPTAPFPIAGLPNHSFVTVVATEANTQVSVLLGGAIESDGQNISALTAGSTLDVTLAPFEVLNLASRGEPGDLTNTVVRASGPVAVFTGAEVASLAPPAASANCCADHLQEQVYPTRSAGLAFVVGRSPARNAASPEPDLFRFVATAEDATVNTNLPAPDNQFTLTPGAVREVWSSKSFVAAATAPISVAQLTIARDAVPLANGDPSLLLVPALEQTRSSYVFAVPENWDASAVVVAAPVSQTVTVDGAGTGGCSTETAGNLRGMPWVIHTCALGAGVHRVESTAPVVATVFGHTVPSATFAFPAGVELPTIYSPPD